MNVLEIKDLTIRFRQQGRFLPVVEGLSLALRPGEVLGLVGESGSGKTVTALAVLGLLDVAPGVIGGSIAYRGNELLDGLANACQIDRNHGTVTAIRKQPRWESAYQQRLAPIRGRRIGMIFQEDRKSVV